MSGPSDQDSRPMAREECLAALRREVQELLSRVVAPVRRVSLRAGEVAIEVEWAAADGTWPGPGGGLAPDPGRAAGALAGDAPAGLIAGASANGSANGSPASANSALPRHAAVCAPVVGTCYLTPAPGAPPFVAVGERIEAGQTVVIVEAMKMMNEVPAGRDGVVVAILVKNGETVEYDQELVLIDSTAAHGHQSAATDAAGGHPQHMSLEAAHVQEGSDRQSGGDRRARRQGLP